ncbi:hypothetical protein ACOZ4N_06060 [Halorientalis pallida]|uniref:hypothetical protein n=1 Tax=Halorientalis pallida TaxID=2479928 RepID=UPI003C6FF89D
MPDVPASRRALLRSGAAVTGTGLLSALAGCQGMLSDGSTATPSGDGGTGAPLTYAPEGSTFVATADLDGLRSDDAFRSAVDDLLGSIPDTPASLSAALDLVRGSTGLDPRAASRLVVYGGMNRYGTVVRADWSTDDVVAGVIGGSARERTYGGRTLYLPDSDDTGAVVASLDGGRYALGGLGAVRDAIDVERGETDPVGGTVRTQYEATRDALVRFGATVPSAVRVTPSGEALSNVTAAHGSITGGESSQLRVNAATAGGTNSVASTLRARIDEIGADIAANPQVDANRVLGEVVDATTVETDGSTVAVPLASFSFDYDEATQVGTISHDGGDAIPASNLYIRGTGFTDTEGAELVGPGTWPSGSDGRVEAGDQVTVGLQSGATIRIVFEGDENTATLASFTGPDG